MFVILLLIKVKYLCCFDLCVVIRFLFVNFVRWVEVVCVVIFVLKVSFVVVNVFLFIRVVRMLVWVGFLIKVVIWVMFGFFFIF